MDESQHYFRIQIAPQSRLRLSVLLFISLLYGIALWVWPYFLPLWFKALCVLALVASLYFYYLKAGSKETSVLYLSATGKIQGMSSSQKLEAEISPASYILPWCVQLHLTSNLDKSSSWLTLYNDQIDTAAIRRLRRIIYRAKQLA